MRNALRFRVASHIAIQSIISFDHNKERRGCRNQRQAFVKIMSSFVSLGDRGLIFLHAGQARPVNALIAASEKSADNKGNLMKSLRNKPARRDEPFTRARPSARVERAEDYLQDGGWTRIRYAGKVFTARTKLVSAILPTILED